MLEENTVLTADTTCCHLWKCLFYGVCVAQSLNLIGAPCPVMSHSSHLSISTWMTSSSKDSFLRLIRLYKRRLDYQDNSLWSTLDFKMSSKKRRVQLRSNPAHKVLTRLSQAHCKPPTESISSQLQGATAPSVPDDKPRKVKQSYK